MVRLLLVPLLLVACAEENLVLPLEPTANVPQPEVRVDEPPAPTADVWVDVTGESLGPALRDHPAPYLLVNVWSTWCEPCIEEMPDVIATANEHDELGLVLIAIDPPRNRDPAREMLEGWNAPMPSWFKVGSDEEFIGALHEEWSGALPATLLMDRERRVRHFWPTPVDSEELRGPIELLLGESG